MSYNLKNDLVRGESDRRVQNMKGEELFIEGLKSQRSGGMNKVSGRRIYLAKVAEKNEIKQQCISIQKS